METTTGHYGQWIAVAIWVVLFGLFLIFTPFYQKSQRKPASVYLAFVIALALEMFGIPLSLYFVTWAFGFTLPEGVFWGHTLFNQIGYMGLYVSYIFYLLGAGLVISGWKEIFKRYWSKDEGKGELVTNGIYAWIRHPQYTGFLMITLGMIFEWATLPLLIMWPLLAWLYYRLARKEEADMQKEFGPAYRLYQERTGMFLPRSWKRQRRSNAPAL